MSEGAGEQGYAEADFTVSPGSTETLYLNLLANKSSATGFDGLTLSVFVDSTLAFNKVFTSLTGLGGASPNARAAPLSTRERSGADDRRPRSIDLGDDAHWLRRARRRWFLGVAQERLYRRLDDANDFGKIGYNREDHHNRRNAP